MRTEVAIIGAGPAGLLLGHLLHAEGIGCVVLERRSREHVAGRIRAGVLENTTTDLLVRLGIDQRLREQGMVEDGFNLATDDRVVRIDLAGLTGRHVTVYGQTEVTTDLIDAAAERGLDVVFEAEDVALHAVDGDDPHVTFAVDGEERRIDCRFIVGCDGFHGVARAAAGDAPTFERAYPFGWLGILADAPPCHPELIYASTRDGFALASMRSPTRVRYYIQVAADERLADWPEARLWDELERRFVPLADRPVTRGPALEMSIAPLRSYVFEGMRHGRLFLAGDAAHIVPPTGAKGLNLAASDVIYLAEAMIGFFATGDEAALHDYPARALARVWQAERFSWSLTRLMHRFPDDGPFEHRMREAELDFVASSRAMQTAIAENYVGLPL